MAVIPDNSTDDKLTNLENWLQHIAAVHPREIELGLDRILAVAGRMGISRPAKRVVTVAGTNGKGTTLATLNALLLADGQKTGLYTSPHVDRFNERILINDVPASDEAICAALSLVESSRKEITLSYFEFATLAALYLFQQAELDVALLEVGLGGRLDAVNIIDADIAVITSIDYDHMDWLGDSLAEIAMEKAGILRTQQSLVLAEPEPPRELLQYCRQLNCHMLAIGEDYHYSQDEQADRWHWQGSSKAGTVNLHDLPLPMLPLSSAAAALQLALALDMELDASDVARVLAGLAVPGRWELRREPSRRGLLLLDVAHNPAAAGLLSRRLQELQRAGVYQGKVAVVFALMADKDVEGIVLSLDSNAHIWYIAQLDEPRALPVSQLAKRMGTIAGERHINAHNTVAEALAAAIQATEPDDLVVVTGSFITVSIARQLSTAL